MATVKNLGIMSGSIGDKTYYTRKGSDKLYVRSKGGPNKNMIAKDPKFDLVRRNNKEFGGCSKMSKEIRQTFVLLAHTADYNLAPTLCSIAKNMQKGDVESALGERSIHLSEYRQYLVGFSFNLANRFDSILRIPIDSEIDRNRQKAMVKIPAFACSMGLYMPGKYAFFSLCISLGVASDLKFNAHTKVYEPTHYRDNIVRDSISTPWYSTQATVPAQDLILDLAKKADGFSNDETLILSIAVQFGTLDVFGNQVAIKNAGAGKILGVS